jgi:hypothetical protein
MNNFWKKLNNWFKKEWELFNLADSVEGMNMSQSEYDKKVEQIKNKYKS